MAGATGTLTIYNKAGTSILYQNNDYSYSSSDKLGDELVRFNIGVSYVSYTIGGQAIDNNTNMLDVGEPGLAAVLYDVTPEPEPETITGFYLDGTKYEFDGGGASYTAGNGIEITNDEIGLDGTYEKSDYSAIQGPAPDGFHVPLTTEWQGLKTIMDGLSLTTGDGWRIKLHMPFTGLRGHPNANLYYQDSDGYYWSSSPSGSDNPNSARILRLDSSYVGTDSHQYRATGCPVRCFKDSYETPTSSWTIITGTLGGAGIFWNQTDGLISITSNGTTGYTIQDKNLGATTVYNNGNTLTKANMGNMYQWGNNYGFPSTGSVTTSSTQVNAQNYGPGNYYSSSTFITGSQNWSSVQNDNLRGGETGVQITSGNLVIGDNLYKIVTSTTAPAAGTASNIITFVIDGGV